MAICNQSVRVIQMYLGEKIYKSIYYIYCYGYYMLLLLEIWLFAGRVFKSYKHILEKRFINQYNKIYYIYFWAAR